MTVEEREFVEWYRLVNRRTSVPCLRCTDEKIVVCSNKEGIRGCVAFDTYLRRTRNETDERHYSSHRMQGVGGSVLDEDCSDAERENSSSGKNHVV